MAIVSGLYGLLAFVHVSSSQSTSDVFISYPTKTSVLSLFFGIVVSLVFVVPIGIITAITNVEIGLNPCVDHPYAIKMIDEVYEKAGKYVIRRSPTCLY